MIVHITDCFHPRLGGIEMQVGELAAAQRARGATVHVITATPAGQGGPRYAYPVHRVVAPLPWELPVHPRAGAHLDRLLRELSPDVVHVHLGSVSPFAWAGVAASLRCGLPTVATVHSLWGPSSRAMYRGLDRLAGWTDAPLIVTAVSRAGAELIMRTRPHLVATAVPNGISTAIWRPDLSDLGDLGDPKTGTDAPNIDTSDIHAHNMDISDIDGLAGDAANIDIPDIGISRAGPDATAPDPAVLDADAPDPAVLDADAPDAAVLDVEAPGDAEARGGSGAVHIVAVGRLAPRKQPLGLLRLLRAARRRLGTDPPVRVSVAGAGPALPFMRAYLRRHHMSDWVHLVGRLDHDGIRALLATADVFVNPTVRESFGLATLEARTAGVPVIARSGNGVAEFVAHGEEGLLCANADEFVSAIVRLVRDTAYREKIRAHNRATEPVACTWPAVTAAFRRCYDRARLLARQPVPASPAVPSKGRAPS